MSSAKKTGRPEQNEAREKLTKITFKADAETMAAIATLTSEASQAGVVAPKSVAIRRALIESANRVLKRDVKNGHT